MANVIEFTIRGIDKASGPLGNVSKTAGTILKTSAAMATAVAAAETATLGFVAAVNRGVDATAKFATRIGADVDALSKMQFVANQAGIATEQFNMAAQRMTRRVAEAAEGTGEARQALVELGIDASKFSKLGLDQQFELIADRMSKTKGPADSLRLAFKLFDSEGTAVLQMLNGGSEAMRKAAADAQFLGVVISKQAAANAELFSDALGRAQASLKGVSRGIAEELTPLFTGLANTFADFVARARPAIVKFVHDVTYGVVAVGIAITQMGQRIHDVFTDYSAFTAFARGMLQLGKNVGAIALSIGKVIVTGIAYGLNVAAEAVSAFSGWVLDALKSLFTGGEIKSFTVTMALGITQALAEARDAIAAQFDGTVTDIGEYGAQAGQAFADAFGINIDLAKQQAAGIIQGLEQFGQVVEDNGNKNIELHKTFLQALSEANEQFISQQKEFSVELANQLYDTMMQTIDAISQGIAGVMVAGGNMMAVLKGIGKAVLQEVIAILIKMGLQRLALAAIERVTTAAQASAQLGAGLAQVYTNSFASAAAIPVVGWAIAPQVAAANLGIAVGGASAAGATGAGLGAGIAGVSHDGMTNIPREGTYLLAGGERIVKPEQNRDLTAFLADGGNAGGGSVVIESLAIHILENATNADALLSMSNAEMREVVARQVIPALDGLARQGTRPQYL